MINLLLTGNENVKDGLLIVILSYLMHNDEPLNVSFLTMDLHQLNPKFCPLRQKQAEYIDNLLKAKNPESSFKLIDCTDLFMETMSKRTDVKSVYTPYALLRLLMDKVDLPDKILYLDTDTMILGNIQELFDIDLKDHEFAASYDYLGRTWISVQYQNSGVMLINLKKVRETKLMEKCRKYVTEKKRLLLDQDALNNMVQEKMYLPFKYNEQHKRQPDTVIRHFSKTIKWIPFFHTQNIKPWMVDKVHDIMKTHEYDEVLNEYLKYKDEFSSLK